MQVYYCVVNGESLKTCDSITIIIDQNKEIMETLQRWGGIDVETDGQTYVRIKKSDPTSWLKKMFGL